MHVTVFDEGLRGHPDPEIAEAARREGRVLVTLDLDFGNIREYPPEQNHGLIVLRVADQSRRRVLGVLERVMTVLNAEPLDGHLWIVSEAGIRVRKGPSGRGVAVGGAAHGPCKFGPFNKERRVPSRMNRTQ